MQQAAATLVGAFAATDTDTYFGCFSPDASFVFHSEPDRLDDRAAYERLWQDWLSAGWRVVSCASTNAGVQLCGDAAVFVHDVATSTTTGGVVDTTSERETIVFRRAADGSVTAVHEHLSPAPTQS